MFVSAPKKTLAHSWSFSLIASGNWTQPHVRSNHNSPGRNNLRSHYGCLTHNCQASRKLLNFSVPTWGSLSLFWICFDSSSFLLNHSALTVASSFFLSPFTLHQTALFGSLSFAVQGADYSFVVIGVSWVGAVVLQEIMTRSVGLATSISGLWVCQQLWLLCQALPRIRLIWTDVVCERVCHHKTSPNVGPHKL